MLIERSFFIGIQRVIPGAGGHLYHAGQNLLAQVHARQNRPAVVIDLHHAAFADVSCLRIARMHPQRLASLNFRRPTDAAVVVLAVQAGAWLTGEQMKRPARRLQSLPGSLFLIPPGMARAFAIAKPGDGRGKEFNLTGGRGKRIALRIGAKIGEKDLRPLRRTVFQHPLLPEILERGQRNALLLRPRP